MRIRGLVYFRTNIKENFKIPKNSCAPGYRDNHKEVWEGINENQFGFMSGRLTIEPIFALRQLTKKYRET